MTRPIATILAITLSPWLLASSVSATPIDYDESVSGDLSGHTFQAASGVNRFRGTINQTIDRIDAGNNQNDLEIFTLELAPGLEIVDLTFDTTLESVSGWAFVAADFVFQEGSTQVARDFDLVFGVPTFTLTDVPPIFPYVEDSYRFVVSTVGNAPASVNVVEYDWEITATVTGSPAPEPSTALLLATGLGGLAMQRKRLH